MRPRRGPQFASAAFALIVVLAVGAVTWGVTHSSSRGRGFGSAKDRAAARTSLLALTLPSGFARDLSFTACGDIADACLTAHGDIAQTLASLTTIMHSAGGSLPAVCSAFDAAVATALDKIAASNGVTTASTRFTCTVDGRLHGARVIFELGSGWWLPGSPTPRTAVMVMVDDASPLPSPPAPEPGTEADAASLLPTAWASEPQPCAGGPTPPASAAASSVPASSAATPSTPVLITAPPLPACAARAFTDNVSVRVALADAASQLAKVALGDGFRLDGHPCIAGATPTTCVVRGERISAGLQQRFVATLTDDGRGDTVGTLTTQSQQT